MLTETARVVALDDESVWVETLRQSSCGSCAARSGCGHGMINSTGISSSRGLVKACLPKDLSLRIGLNDTVEIAIPERGFLQAAGMLYAMPLLTTVLAALLADQYWSSAALTQAALDLRITVAAATGLAAGLLLLRQLSGRMSRRWEFQPRVTGVH